MSRLEWEGVGDDEQSEGNEGRRLARMLLGGRL